MAGRRERRGGGEVKGRIVATAVAKGREGGGGKARQVFTHKETERESHGHWLRHSGMHRVSSVFAFRDQIYVQVRTYVHPLDCETRGKIACSYAA